jgi:CheY-like chemotaxis protein
MPPELVPRVFDLFAQGDRSLARSEGGLGIGLTLVKTLTDMHGGSVTASSNGPSRGSEFVVRLPAAVTPAPTPGDKLSGPGEAPTRGKRILVVDDNRDLALGMSRLLSMVGHTVQTVYNGPAAIEAARESLPEVILLDIGLPGMDGYEVAANLRTAGQGNRPLIVAVTGYGHEEDVRRSLESGFDYHLVKPVDHNTLLSLLEKAGSPR